MWNPSYLLATLDQLSNYLEITNAAFDESKGTFTCTLKTPQMEAPLEIPTQWFVENLGFDWSELLNRAAAYRLLTGYRKPLDTLERAACFLYVHRTILEHGIDHADGWKDNDKYCIRYRAKDKSLTTLYSINELSSAVAAECLLRGYSVEEHIGSHYTTATPKGLKHITSTTTCSCKDYTTRRACHHTHLVRAAFNHRRELLQARLLRIV